MPNKIVFEDCFKRSKKSASSAKSQPEQGKNLRNPSPNRAKNLRNLRNLRDLSQPEQGKNLWNSVKSVGPKNSKEENLRNPSPSRASRKEDSEKSPPIFKPPEEVPSPEDRLTKSLCRIEPNEMHIPPYFQEILLPHTLMRKPTILSKVPTKVTPIKNLRQQQLPSLPINRRNHPLLRHPQHLLHHIHHRPRKLPQSQKLQLPLHHIQSSRRRTGSKRRESNSSRSTSTIRSHIPTHPQAVPARKIWRDL